MIYSLLNVFDDHQDNFKFYLYLVGKKSHYSTFSSEKNIDTSTSFNCLIIEASKVQQVRLTFKE